MHDVKKAFAGSIAAFLAFLMVLSALSLTSAAPVLTLNPSSGPSGSTVTVTGTGFPATTAVGIGFGAETGVDGEIINQTASGVTRTGYLGYWPDFPGTVVLTNTRVSDGRQTLTYDDGAGNIYQVDNTFFATINYTSGRIFRDNVNQALSDYVLTASYYHYQYNVTPAAGVTTDSTGAFTTSIIVPSGATGTYTVTAVTGTGNRATSTFSLGTVIPEFPAWTVLTIAAIVLPLATIWIRKKRT